ncbi:MAG: McrC family protein [Bacteroidetes bacterium]|nr:McrC family protein [Fibrella sp.]
MKIPHTITEYGTIRRGADYPGRDNSLTELFLPDTAFDALKRLAAEPEADTILTFSLQKGREVLRTRNYVGLLETRNGTQLEILPKITTTLPTMRLALLQMLRHVQDSPFRQLGTAHVKAAHLPLREVLITAFLADVAPVVAQGLQRAYVPTEATLPVLRGKWRMAEQIRRHVVHAERFAVEYDAFTADIPPNRLLKACLQFVAPRARTIANQTRIRQLLFALDEVPASGRVRDDLQAAQTGNRLLLRYSPVLRWAEILLLNRSIGVSAGRHLTLALLFPMERVFEAYVAAGFRRVVPADELTIQESSAHLVEEHGGRPTFRLRPDLIIRRPNQLIIVDTKWKTIHGTGAGDAPDAGTYGIEQADLYQLYAYGKKYNATELVLIYPANETFTQPLRLFGYDPTLTLRVIPFDLTNVLDDEVEKVLNFTLLYRPAT